MRPLLAALLVIVGLVGLQAVTAPSAMAATVSPTTGPTTGGTHVTMSGLSSCMSGTAFAYLTTTGAPVVVNSCGGSSANLTMPSAPTGTTTIKIEYLNSSNFMEQVSTANFTYGAAPTITSSSPTGLTSVGGTIVTFSGTNLSSVTSATFNGSPGTITSAASGSLVVTSPAGSAGPASVVITSPYGSASTTLTYFSAPIVSSVSPTHGTVTGGTAITIAGKNFGGTCSVSIGGHAATGVSVLSATSITATTPSGTAGSVTVAVTCTENGTSQTGSLANGFSYDAPVVTSVSPISGATTGGTAVTITGANFSGTCTAKFNNVSATGTATVNATTITGLSTPAGSAGDVNVSVTCGSATGTGNALFTYVAPPTITAISPTTAWTSGGETITLTGTGLASVTAVTFGGTNATSWHAASATEIIAVTPAKAAGSQAIQVSSPYGDATTTVTYVQTPSVTSATPSTRSTAGGQLISIHGSGFSGTPTVTIGGAAATDVTLVSSTALLARTPARTAGTAGVQVTTTGGGASNTLNITYAAPATITSVSPSSGTTDGGTSVTITGTNFTGATAVVFAGEPATSVTVVDANTITAVTPAGSAGGASIGVGVPAGATFASGLYTYVAPSSGGGGAADTGGTPSPSPSPTPTPTAEPERLPEPALSVAPSPVAGNANLRPGQVRVLVDGEQTTVRQSSDPSAGTVTLRGAGWSGTFGEKSGGKAVPLGESGVLDLSPGDRLSVSMKGYLPGSDAGVVIFSTPVQVGTMTVSSSGSLSGSFSVPSSVPAGRHTLQVNGYTSSGGLRSVALGIVVSTSAKKPGTGKGDESDAPVPTVINAGATEVTPQTVTGSGPRGTIVFEGQSISLTGTDEAELDRILAAVPSGSRVAVKVTSTSFGSREDGEALAQARLRPVVHHLHSGSLVVADLTMGTRVQGGSPERGEVAVTLTVLD